MEGSSNLSSDLQSHASNETAEKDSLIIGLDFGTTFSGVAYAFSQEPEHVFCIDTWPSANDKRVPKAPTIMTYNSKSKSCLKWGYEVDHLTQNKIERFKLLLDPEQEISLNRADNTKVEMANLGKDVMEIASDYLRAIYQHALQFIEQSHLEDYIRGLEKEYVLSVPAIWSDKAKDMTMRAASKAGIGPITLIKEPEAAALYTLHFNRKKGLRVGDAIIVCDAGGGTVDLISYEILRLVPLELKELAPCSGQLCGSILLNERFEEWIQSVVGHFSFLALRTTLGFRSAMQSFETVLKPGFSGRGDSKKYVSFPMAKLKDSPSKGVDCNSVVVTGETLFELFDPVIKGIKKLVSEQVETVRNKRQSEKHPKGDSVKAIFLVGGFGSNMYLKQAIQSSHPDIQVLQPPDAWSAIAKGAVMSKLPREASVTSNNAEKHYGTCCSSSYDQARDKYEPFFKDEWDETYRCRTMEWFIYKDDELVREKKVSLRVRRYFGGETPDPKDLKFTDELYESTALEAPIHPRNVKKNCVLDTDLTQVSRHYFNRKTRESDGAPYTALDYNLLIEIQSGPMKFSLEVDGKQYSAVNASY